MPTVPTLVFFAVWRWHRSCVSVLSIGQSLSASWASHRCKKHTQTTPREIEENAPIEELLKCVSHIRAQETRVIIHVRHAFVIMRVHIDSQYMIVKVKVLFLGFQTRKNQYSLFPFLRRNEIQILLIIFLRHCDIVNQMRFQSYFLCCVVGYIFVVCIFVLLINY